MNEKELQEQEYLDLEVEIDTEEFNKGAICVSELAGKIAGLTSVGIPPAESLAYFLQLETFKHEQLINQTTIEHNQKLNTETCANNLKVAEINAKVQSEMLDSRMM